MSIITRFKEIMASNINALLDKAENPEKMIDQYLRNLNQDLGKVKSETASVMAEEQRARRAVNDCQEEIDKMERYAIKALEANNEADARKFLERKTTLAPKLSDLQAALQLAAANSEQMKQMHDKLVADIGELEAKRTMLKAKWSVAKTQEKVTKLSGNSANSTLSAFDRMEDKVNQALDEANAMAELNAGPKDEIEDLTAKYDDVKEISAVDDELAALKAKLQNKQ